MIFIALVQERSGFFTVNSETFPAGTRGEKQQVSSKHVPMSHNVTPGEMYCLDMTLLHSRLVSKLSSKNVKQTQLLKVSIRNGKYRVYLGLMRLLTQQSSHPKNVILQPYL